MPFSPLPNPSIHLCSRDAIPDQTHHYSQTLHVSIPYLIVEEEYFLVWHSTRLVYPREMRFLVPRENLHMVEVLDRTLVTRLYVKLLEESICQVRRVGSGSCSKQKRRRKRFGSVKDARNFAVEGERFAQPSRRVSHALRKDAYHDVVWEMTSLTYRSTDLAPPSLAFRGGDT